MSSQLMHPSFNTYGKTKRKPNARTKQAQAQHNEWLRSRGLAPDQIESRKKKPINQIPDYKTDTSDLSNSIGNGFKKQSVLDTLSKEAPSVRDEILRKASRTAPGYNKGNYIYVTDGMDPSQIGTRSRRP